MATGTDGVASTTFFTQRIFAGYTIAAPGANTDFITDRTPSKNAVAWRIFITLTTGSVVNLMVSDGTNEYAIGLNESGALNAGDGYSFTVPVSRTDDGTETGTALTYNMQVETDSVIRQVIIDEVSMGMA